MATVSGAGSDGHEPVTDSGDGQTVTRRQLLTAIGVAGGAGVLAGAFESARRAVSALHRAALAT